MMKARVVAGLHHGWSKRSGESYAEKFWRQELEKLGLIKNQDFIQEWRVRRDDSALSYFVDFFFPHYNLALEIDGSQHKFRREHDVVRDIYLQSLGITVIRYPWVGTNTKARYDEVIDQIRNFYTTINQAAIVQW